MPSGSTSRTSSYHDHDHDHDTLAPDLPQLRQSKSAISNHSQSRLAYHRPSCQQEECEHGLYSPHASRPNSSSSVRPPDTNNPSDYTPTHLGYEPEPSDGLEQSESGNGGVFGGRYAGERDLRHGILGDAVADGVLGDGTGDENGKDSDGDDQARRKWKGTVAVMSTTQWLAKRHGITRRRTMYVLRSLQIYKV